MYKYVCTRLYNWTLTLFLTLFLTEGWLIIPVIINYYTESNASILLICLIAQKIEYLDSNWNCWWLQRTSRWSDPRGDCQQWISTEKEEDKSAEVEAQYGPLLLAKTGRRCLQGRQTRQHGDSRDRASPTASQLAPFRLEYLLLLLLLRNGYDFEVPFSHWNPKKFSNFTDETLWIASSSDHFWVHEHPV